jgi:phosphatidylinositol kinase/protein kinase (PI-3  family)
MNDIFGYDTECYRRKLRMVTYEVLPMTKNSGIVEWVTNTRPFKSLIEHTYK